MKIALIYDNQNKNFSIFIDEKNVVNTDDDTVANDLFNELRLLSNNCNDDLLKKKEVINNVLHNTK